MARADTSTDGGRSRGAAFVAEMEHDRAHRAKAKTLQPLRRLAPYVFRYPGTLAAFTFFLALAAVLTLTLPAAGRLLVDCGFSAAPDKAYCARFALGDPGALGAYFKVGLVVAVALGLTSALRYFFVSRLGERVVADLRRAVYDHLTTLSPSFFATARTGEVLSRLTTDTTLIQSVVGSTVSIAVRTAATTLGAFVMMLLVSWKLTLMVIAIGPAILIPIFYFGSRLQRLSRDGQDRLAEASARAGESLAAIETVQAFTREAEERAAFGGAVETTYDVAMRRIRVRAMMTAVLFALGLSSFVGVLWFGAAQVAASAITAGAMAQFAMYAFLAVSGFGFLTETYAEMMRAAGATERLMELLSAKSDIDAPPAPAKLGEPKGEIVFDNVAFAYPTRPDMQALRGVSFRVNPGETVALVGPSGAGKTTVFQLLLRFYDPQTGAIRVDGAELHTLDPRDLRAHIAVVQQNAPLFSGSAWHNIRYGRVDAGDEEVREAAEAAYADEFLSKLPEGYDADLGERAASLSGGQRQRIAVARAILRNAPILLLDEATSALDAESERAVQQAFEAISRDRTTIVIAHRLATVLRADRILVMEEGRIVDEGTHEELLGRGGLYARLAKLQFEDGARGLRETAAAE